MGRLHRRLSRCSRKPARAQVAILGPTSDVWSDHALDRNPWNTTPWYLHALWQALNHHGFGADYVNGKVLREATFEDGEIRSGPMRYRALILTDVATVAPGTAEALERYAAAGGRVLFVGKPPGRSPGLIDRDLADARVEGAIERVLAAHPGTVRGVAPPEEETLVSRAGEWMQSLGVDPAVRLAPVDDRLFFTQARSGDREIFFFANASRDRDVDFTATFAVLGKTAWRWDPETGERGVYGTGVGGVEISLEPLQSLLLVREPTAADGPIAPRSPRGGGLAREITGPWRVSLQGLDGAVEERTLPALEDLSRLEGLEAFSGTAVYRAGFEVPKAGDYLLDLGDVRETSEVEVNGAAVGVRWYGRHRYVLAGALRPGENELEVRVTTLAFNHYRAQDGNAMAQYWMGRTRQQGPLPSGLIGPVVLVSTSGEAE